MSIASVVGGIKSEPLSEDETPARTLGINDVKPTLVNGTIAGIDSAGVALAPLNTYISHVEVKMETSPGDHSTTPDRQCPSGVRVTPLSLGIRPVVVGRSNSDTITDVVRSFPRDNVARPFNEATTVSVSNSANLLRTQQPASLSMLKSNSWTESDNRVDPTPNPLQGHPVVLPASAMAPAAGQAVLAGGAPPSKRTPSTMYIVSSAPSATPIIRGNLIQHTLVSADNVTNPLIPVIANQNDVLARSYSNAIITSPVVHRSLPVPSPVITRSQLVSLKSNAVIANRQSVISTKQTESATVRPMHSAGVSQLCPITYVVAVARDNAAPRTDQRLAAPGNANVKYLQSESEQVESSTRDASSLGARYTDILERYLAHFHITIGDFYNWLMKTYKTNTLLQEQLFVKADEFITLIAKLLFTLPDVQSAAATVQLVHGISESSLKKWATCKELFRDDRTVLKYLSFKEILPARNMTRNRFVQKLEAVTHFRQPYEREPAAMPDIPNGNEKDFIDIIQEVLAYYMLRASLLDELPMKHNLGFWRHMSCKPSPVQMCLYEIQTLVFHQSEMELFRSLFNYRDTAYFYETSFKRREAPSVRLLYRIPVARVAQSLISTCSDDLISSFVKLPLHVDGSTNILGDLRIDEKSKRLTVPQESVTETAAIREKIKRVLLEYEKMLR